jgi:hypothetical protein
VIHRIDGAEGKYQSAQADVQLCCIRDRQQTKQQMEIKNNVFAEQQTYKLFTGDKE